MATTTERIPVAGVPLSHPERLIYPELGVSKADLARYFEGIAEWVVPHVRHRPLTLLHCPAGASEPCLFLRHGKAWGPNALRRIRIREKTKVGEYLVADDLAGVVSLVQMGIVEIHTWNSVADDLERPNRIVWDLDPGPQVEWPAVVEAARLLRRRAGDAQPDRLGEDDGRARSPRRRPAPPEPRLGAMPRVRQAGQ